jgi:hypothetical protein
MPNKNCAIVIKMKKKITKCKITTLFMAFLMSMAIFGVSVTAESISVSNTGNSNEIIQEPADNLLTINWRIIEHGQEFGLPNAQIVFKDNVGATSIIRKTSFLQTAVYYIYGRVSNFYQDEEVISFHADSVIVKEMMFVLVPLYFGKIKILFPLFKRRTELICNEDIKIVKDDYVYQNYRFYNKETFLIGIATYYEN